MATTCEFGGVGAYTQYPLTMTLRTLGAPQQSAGPLQFGTYDAFPNPLTAATRLGGNGIINPDTTPTFPGTQEHLGSTVVTAATWNPHNNPVSRKLDEWSEKVRAATERERAKLKADRRKRQS